jgi:DNA-binding CsgD family transcriptional regulator
VAHETFTALGAAPWAEQAATELRAAGARRRSTAPDETLTAQQLRVARAAASGATTREIAAELFLSPKTVEFHLGQTYRKLGVRSRAALVTRLAELSEKS